jgi:hypothetical protein
MNTGKCTLIFRAVIVGLVIASISNNSIVATNSTPVFDASKPITAREWTLAGNGIGAWTICQWVEDDQLGRPKYRPDPSPATFDSLQSIGVRCTRLHLSIGNTDPDVYMDPKTHRLQPPIMKRIEDFIDLATERNMAVMMQFGLQKETRAIKRDEKYAGKDNAQKRAERIILAIRRHLEVWKQCSEEFKNKSYLFAMAPFIECHIFDGAFPAKRSDSTPHFDYLVKEFPWLKGAKDQKEALNLLYHEFTRIYREHNPQRVMGYKPYGVGGIRDFPAGGKGKEGVKLYSLPGVGDKVYSVGADFLDFPFGDDSGTTHQIAIMPMPHTEVAYYDWNINKEHSNKDIIEISLRKPRIAKLWRKKTGIEIFNDHGYWRASKASSEKAINHSKKKGKEIRTYTNEQAAEGLKNILVWSAMNRIPFTAIQISGFIIPQDGSLIRADTKISKITGPLKDTTGISGKELKLAKSENAKRLKAQEEWKKRKARALAIISAYREATAEVARWKAQGGDPNRD